MAIPTFVDSSYASTNSVGATVTCNYPAGSASGDLLVMFAGFRRTSAASFTLATPAGWNLLDTQNQSATYNHCSATYWRFRGAETSVSVVASLATSMYGSIQIHAYNGDVDPTTPINASFLKEQGTPTNSTADRLTPAVTTTSVDCAVSLFGITNFIFSGRGFDWPGATELNSVHSGSNGDLYFTSALTTQPTAGSTGTYIMRPTGGAIDEVHSATIAIQPNQVLTVNADDAIALTDDAYVAAQAYGTDSATLTESDATITNSDTDAITLSDTANVIAQVYADDSVALTDTAYARAVVYGTDDVTFAEDAYVSNSIVVSEDITLTESDATVTNADTDAISISETAYARAQVYADDAISLTENAWIRVTADPDAINLTDTAKVLPGATDSISIVSEVASIAVHVFADDSIAIQEDAGISVYADDSATLTDNAFRLVSGLLQFPRMVKIPNDDRRIIIEREPRRVSIDPDYRVTSVRPEVRRHYVIAPDKRVFKIDAEE